jgi:hypothetical protein
MRFCWFTLFIVLLTSVFRPQQADAQLFYSGTEYGIVLGGSHYFGDLNDQYGLKDPHFAAGIFLRQHLTPYISVRGSAIYTKVGYSDSYSKNDFYQMRNLSFTSDIVELAAQAEFNFTRFFTGEINHRFTPYLTGGLVAFYYNPYAYLNGQRYFLRKLGTEGQNLSGYEDRKYGTVGFAVPVGIGLKWWIKPGFNLGVEIADRLTLNDHLDDVSTSYVGADKFPNNPDFPNPAYYLQDRSLEVSSVALGRAGKQRGNSETFDQYMVAVFHLSFQLKVYRCPNYLQSDVWQE